MFFLRGQFCFSPGWRSSPCPVPLQGRSRLLVAPIFLWIFSLHSVGLLFLTSVFFFFRCQTAPSADPALLQCWNFPPAGAGCPCAVPPCHRRGGWALLPSSLPISSSGMLIQNEQQDPNFPPGCSTAQSLTLGVCCAFSESRSSCCHGACGKQEHPES